MFLGNEMLFSFVRTTRSTKICFALKMTDSSYTKLIDSTILIGYKKTKCKPNSNLLYKIIGHNSIFCYTKLTGHAKLIGLTKLTGYTKQAGSTILVRYTKLIGYR